MVYLAHEKLQEHGPVKLININLSYAVRYMKKGVGS